LQAWLSCGAGAGYLAGSAAAGSCYLVSVISPRGALLGSPEAGHAEVLVVEARVLERVQAALGAPRLAARAVAEHVQGVPAVPVHAAPASIVEGRGAVVVVANPPARAQASARHRPPAGLGVAEAVLRVRHAPPRLRRLPRDAPPPPPPPPALRRAVSLRRPRRGGADRHRRPLCSAAQGKGCPGLLVACAPCYLHSGGFTMQAQPSSRRCAGTHCTHAEARLLASIRRRKELRSAQT